MTTQPITVETTVAAPIATIWDAYATPGDIMQWNTPSEDWHTPAAAVDLRQGGAFSSRMEAKEVTSLGVVQVSVAIGFLGRVGLRQPT